MLYQSESESEDAVSNRTLGRPKRFNPGDPVGLHLRCVSRGKNYSITLQCILCDYTFSRSWQVFAGGRIPQCPLCRVSNAGRLNHKQEVQG